MVRKALYGVGIGVLLSVMLVLTVRAQIVPTTTNTADQPVIEPILASLVQSVPVTLTLSVPGPTGTQTIQVPIVLSFDIQVGISNQITTSVVVTAVDETVAEETVEETPPVDSAADTQDVATATPTAARIGIVPTATPGATPTAVAVPPTATPQVVDTTEPEAPSASQTETEEPASQAEAGGEAGTEPETAEPEPGAEQEGDEPNPPEEGSTEEGSTEEGTTEEGSTEEGDVEEVVGEACAMPGMSISSPVAGQVVSGTVAIMGSATHENFDYYKLEYDIVGDDAENFVYFDGTETQVAAALLGNLDSDELPNGPLTVRLTVVDHTGNFPPPCDVTFIVSN